MESNKFFYKKLPVLKIGLADIMIREDLFRPVPQDWHIVVVDIEKSTQAIKNGLHHQVNLAASSSIIAVLNKFKTYKSNVIIPYFFGGDGATFIIPKFALKGVLIVLENLRHHVRKTMYLSLKVGSISAKEVYKSEKTINIAKVSINPYLNIPVVLGMGLKDAESIIKSKFIDETNSPNKIEELDLNGMECRWQEIKPNEDEVKIICLLVNGISEDTQNKAFYNVLKSIQDIFGDYEKWHPISVNKLKLDLSLKKMWNEMYSRLGRNSYVYLIKNWLITIIGNFYFKLFKDGKDYVQKVQKQSYTIMIDGALNIVMSGKQSEVDKFITVLDKLEVEDKINYGIHVTHSSIMSCYVQDRKSNHIHFVDGTEGGFTSAAKKFKKKAS